MTAIWALALVIITAILAAAALGIQRTRSETTDKASVRQFDLRAQRLSRTFHPCAAVHDFVVVELKPVAGSTFLCTRNTVALYRCRKCQTHQSAIFPGDWKIESFLKTQADEQWLDKELGAGK